jgi:hypothetical protein
VYQNSSKSGDKWPTYSSSLIFKMAAAATFQNDRIFPVLCILDSASSSQYVYQISSKSGDKWPVYSILLVLAVFAC